MVSIKNEKKNIPKFMIPIHVALLETFSSYDIITGIEVSHKTIHSSKSDKLKKLNLE